MFFHLLKINNINSKEQENIETRIEKLGLNSDMQNIPASLNLSNMAMESYLMTEIGNLVFISCVDGALRKGIKKE